MPGTSCLNCAFATYEKSNQVGCLLDRTEKLTSVDVLSDDYSFTYKMLPHNACTSKRSKDWLAGVSGDSVEAVRKELFPKVQLILIIDKITDNWIDYLRNVDLSLYNVVDVLVLTSEKEMVNKLGFLLHSKKFFLHAIAPDLPITHHINYRVRNDCLFYVVLNEIKDDLYNLPTIIDDHINDECKTLAMINVDSDQNQMVVYTPIHFYLGGFGSQDLREKIRIDAINNDYQNAIFDFDR